MISRLPKNEKTREKAIQIIKDNGIDDFILFDDILRYVINKLDIGPHYNDSEFLQTIRLLKIYGFFIKPMF